MSRPRFSIDFNELLEPNLVLLSKGDERQDVLGLVVRLAEGMPVEVCDQDLGDDGERDDLIARGRAVLNRSTGAWAHVKWCCLIDDAGIRHMSDIAIGDEGAASNSAEP